MTDRIDRKQLAELLESMGGDWSFVDELLETFFADGPVQLQSLEQGLAAGDAEVVRRAAHTVKSNARSFGAVTLTELSKQLEDAGKDGDLSTAAEQIAQIANEYQAVVEELQEIRRQGGL